MGHKVVAGLASKSEVFGKPLLRIDIPENGSRAALTQFYGLDTIYCITPVDEKTARAVSVQNDPKPVACLCLPSPSEEPETRKCRVCGCTDDDCRQCIEKTGSPCHWVEEDLCSACAQGPKYRVCRDCGNGFIDQGDRQCPECDSDNTEIQTEENEG
jgi:hypothetical protein